MTRGTISFRRLVLRSATVTAQRAVPTNFGVRVDTTPFLRLSSNSKGERSFPFAFLLVGGTGYLPGNLSGPLA
jgi:hypothetical protein